MRFTFIQTHRKRWPIATMCRVLKVSRSGHYAWLKRPPSARQKRRDALADRVRTAHESHRGVYGSPRVHRVLIA